MFLSAEELHGDVDLAHCRRTDSWFSDQNWDGFASKLNDLNPGRACGLMPGGYVTLRTQQWLTAATGASWISTAAQQTQAGGLQATLLFNREFHKEPEPDTYTHSRIDVG